MEDREALIKLAETLDDARKQANAIEATAPQIGVYGDISVALLETLGIILYRDGGHGHSSRRHEVYASLLDGNTVREALAIVGAL